MASSTGWLKLHRKLQDSDIFNDPDLLRLWLLCLMKASHSSREVMVQGEKVELEPGQFLTGRSALYDDYNKDLPNKHVVKDTTLWNRLKKLESMGSLTIESLPTRKASVITLNNWEEHQTEETKKTPKRTKKEEDPEIMSEFLKTGEESKDLDLLPEKDEKKKGKRIYTKEDIEYNLSARLFYWILQNNPKAKKPNPQKWADVIRLMIERDNREPEDIKAVIDWSQNDDFWMSNILSTDKLRKQFDTLYMQMERDRKKKEQARKGTSRNGNKNDLLRNLMEKEAQNNDESGHNKAFLLD